MALAFTMNVTVVVEVDTLPEVEEGVSQLGTPEIEYLMLPDVALSWYWKWAARFACGGDVGGGRRLQYWE